MNKIYEVNFYTCANNKYMDFAPIFILSNLFFNKDCFVEIGISEEKYAPIQKALNIINDNFSNDFLVRKVDFGLKIGNKNFKVLPNTVRFYTEPKIKSKYIYISDIDIINLESNICGIHTKNMERTGLPYSNIVRKNLDTSKDKDKKYRLSGLHFSPYGNYYPIPNFQDLCQSGFLIQDEIFLYQLVKKRYKNFIYDEAFRPVHGIHVSPNRKPVDPGNPNWGMYEKWKEPWSLFRNSDIFKLIEPSFTDYIKDKILVIDEHYSL